jgi:hypothetical protein
MSDTDLTSPIRFTLNEELVVKAAQLASSRYYVRFLWFALITGLLTAIFFMFSRGRLDIMRDAIGAVVIVSFALAIATIILILLRYLIYPFYARKNFQQQIILSEEMSLSWTDNVICYAAGKSRTEMPFKNFHGYRASDEIIILYLSDAIYQMIPVNVFGSSEILKIFLGRLEEAGLRRL